MRYFKFFFKFSIILLFCLLIIWIIVVVIFQTKQGKNWFSERSTQLIEQYTGFKAEFENLDFIFPLGIKLDHLKLSKEKETLITIEEISGFSLSPRLLLGKIVCSDLSAKGIKIFSKPQSNTASPSPHSFLLPDYLKLKKIDLQDIQLMPELIDQLELNPQTNRYLKNFSFNLQGKLSSQTHLILTAHDQTQSFAPIILEINGQSNQLSLSLHADRLSISESSLTASVEIESSASFESWIKLLNDAETMIDGNFKVYIPEKEMTLTSQYQILSSRDIQLYDFQAHDSFIDLKGEARLLSQEVEGGIFEGEVRQFENNFLVQGKINGPFKDLLIQLDISTPQIKWKNQFFDHFHSSLQTNFEWDKADGSIDLNFESNQIPYHLITDFHWNKQFEFIFLKEFVIEALESQLVGEVKIDTTDYFLEGSLQAQGSEIEPLSRIAKLDIAGQADLQLNFMPIFEFDHYRQGIECHLNAGQIRSKDWIIEKLLLRSIINPDNLELDVLLDLTDLKWKDYSIERGSLKLNCQNLWSDRTGQCEFVIHQAANPSFSIQTISGQTELTASERSWPFKIQARGNFSEKWEMETAGFWHATLNEIQLHVAELEGVFGNSALKIQQPLNFVHNFEKTSLDSLYLQLGDNQLSASFINQKDQFELDFKTNILSSELLKLFSVKLPFTGYASLTGHLKGRIDEPTGFVHIDFQKLQFDEDYFIKKALLKGKIELELPGRGIKINSQIFGIGQTPLLVKGILPYNVHLFPFNLSEKEAPLLDLEISGEGDIDSYLPLFMEDYPNISGQIKMALQFGGDLENPVVKGRLSLQDGIYENQETGAIYDHIVAHLEGQGSQINLKSLSANDSQGGTLQIDGSIHLDQKNHFPFDFRINTSRIYLIHSDYASVSASGPLSLIGDLNKSKLKGNLSVNQSIVRLEEALPKQIKIVDFNYINIPEGNSLPFIDKSVKSALELDIKLNAEEVVIEGNGLKSAWKGEIAISGTNKQPLLFGDLHISKGLYDLKGKTFNLSQGSIHFSGSAEKKTTLYVVASKEIDNLKVEIIVKGPLNKLSFSFRSNPPFSQREILSYILFNKGISDITTGEGDTLNQSFISLNSSDQTEEKQDLLTRLRNNMGIDRLDFTSAGEGENKDFALQVGKYLWDGVFISLNKSIGAAPDRIAIEAKLMKNVKAEAEVDIGSSSQGKISLKWKKDY